ncbi:MAG: hypothetical protein JXQ73_02830 [Phycisphaerae bacterium]|nr:hypothetical protein [Phycisphaerae bacterium]
MKKILMILGAVFLVLILVCAGVLVWAQRSGSSHQDAFFQAVLSGNAKQVMALFDPALCEQVDEPVLAAWVAAFRDNLGPYKGLSKTDFDTQSKIEGGATITESKGAVDFEKGQARSEIRFRDGKIVAFHVTSDALPDGWFKGPVGTELYRERGKAFLTDFLSGRPDDAFKMMHKRLQTKLPLEKLKAMTTDFVGKAGKLESIVYDSEVLTPGDVYTLRVVYKVACEKQKPTGTVEFQFDGMKGHLLAFNLK